LLSPPPVFLERRVRAGQQVLGISAYRHVPIVTDTPISSHCSSLPCRFQGESVRVSACAHERDTQGGDSGWGSVWECGGRCGPICGARARTHTIPERFGPAPMMEPTLATWQTRSARAHTRTPARPHTRTYARTHARTHASPPARPPARTHAHARSRACPMHCHADTRPAAHKLPAWWT